MAKSQLIFETVKGLAMISLDHLFSVEIISTENEEKFGPVSKILFKFLLPDSSVHSEVFHIPTERVKSLLQTIMEMAGES